MEKAIHAKKPFREEDRGYRDTMIWETILLTIANKDEITIFVTDNKEDFAYEDKPKLLHDHLKADLEKEGLSRDAVIIYADLNDCVKLEILPLLAGTHTETINDLKKGGPWSILCQTMVC